MKSWRSLRRVQEGTECVGTGMRSKTKATCDVPGRADQPADTVNVLCECRGEYGLNVQQTGARTRMQMAAKMLLQLRKKNSFHGAVMLQTQRQCAAGTFNRVIQQGHSTGTFNSAKTSEMKCTERAPMDCACSTP